MAIYYGAEHNIFTLQTKHSTYQMKADDFGFLLHLYYGGRTEENMDYLLTYYDRGFSGNPYDAGEDRTYSMDALPQEYPVMGTGDYRNSAFVIRGVNEAECCDLRYTGYEICSGKYALPGLPAVFAEKEEAQTLTILLEDRVSKVQVHLLYGVLEEEDIITRSARIVNNGKEEVHVEKAASACLDFLNGNYDLISFYGRHAMERNFQRAAVVHGSQSVGSRRGTSSHQYNPAVIVADQDTTEDHGNCYGMVFVYSGNFLCEAEKDQYGQTRVLMGMHGDQFHYSLMPGEELIVPETILCYSEQGFGELSVRYHRCIRDHICRGQYSHAKRPILVNSWEAAYFQFNGETICELAKDAAKLGIDMVVMDDGWFGKREDDNTGLGDWKVNEDKLGCTLGELVQRVNDMGVKFGIWIEPEMISEDSDLYRAHPDWAFRIPGRNPIRGRNQLTLDFSRKDVRDYIFDEICKVLDQGNIEYVKWDMNRSIADVYSVSGRQGRVAHEYVLGVYDFLEKMTARYPHILLEGCSGGGGRFDAGMMYYTPQIWCSDNTDALDRLQIQYGTSFFYPMSTVSAHVSAVPNHQTGRSVSLHTRGIVAATGAFGYELSLQKLTKEEKEEVREQIREYRLYEELIRTGDYYRLSSPFADEYTAWLFVSRDKQKALLHVVMTQNHGNMTVNYVKLKGLLPDGIYHDTESKRCYAGSALMNAGIPLPAEMGAFCAYRYLFELK